MNCIPCTFHALQKTRRKQVFVLVPALFKLLNIKIDYQFSSLMGAVKAFFTSFFFFQPDDYKIQMVDAIC